MHSCNFLYMLCSIHAHTHTHTDMNRCTISKFFTEAVKTLNCIYVYVSVYQIYARMYINN